MTHMTRAERALLDGVDGVLAVIASLQPKKPADSKAKFFNLNLATASAKLAHQAIVYWGAGDLASAAAFLADAKRILAATEGGALS